VAKLKGALIGCGMISEFHLRGWKRIPEVEIVSLYNRTVQKAEERRQQFFPEAKVYGDVTAMLKQEQLDFVDILSPPALHAEHCHLAQQHNLHIICQKPLCDDLKEAKQLVSSMNDYHKLFAVHENHRYRPWFQQILKLLREDFFGTPVFVRLEQLDSREPGEAYKLESEQGILLEYGTHLVDMIRALLGEPQRVYARTHHYNPNVKGESLVHVAYEYPQTTAIIDTAWKPEGVSQGSVVVEGTKGEAYYEGTMTRGEKARFRLTKNRTVILDEERSPYNDYVESFYLLEREFTDAVLNGGPIIQTGDENLRTLHCTYAAYQSAKEQKVINIGGQSV
jgi:D-apiose dehydrogenase